jgi:Putative zinc ribbon domain
MSNKNTICQSCSMPLKRDPNGGSTNADGTINDTYCSYCFKDGNFILKDVDVKTFQEHCRLKMIEGGHNKIIAWLFTRGLSRLDRWKSR